MKRPSKKAPAVSFTLMSGAEALKDENVLKLFEQIKGRKATDAEVAELHALSAKTSDRRNS